MLNDISFDRVVPGIAEDKGGALLAKEDLDTDDNESRALLSVPRDLILSLERVQQHAKVDKDLREVLETLGDFGRVCLTFRFVRHRQNQAHGTLLHTLFTYFRTPCFQSAYADFWSDAARGHSHVSTYAGVYFLSRPPWSDGCS